MTDPSPAHSGLPPAAQPPFILAMDHRDSFGRSIWDEPVADYLAGHIDRDAAETQIADRYAYFGQQYLGADAAPGRPAEARSEPFTCSHPRLTPDLEAIIGKAVAGADPRTNLPAWMTQTLLAEVDAFRTGE